MQEEKQERLDFLTRMALVVTEADREKFDMVMAEKEDFARLVKMCCLAEKEADDRQQRYFERLCETPGVSFYEA